MTDWILESTFGENVQFDADNNMYTFMPSGITVSLSPNDGLNGVHVSIPGNIPGEPLANFVERWEDDAVGDRIVAVLNQLRDHPIPAPINLDNNSNQNMDGMDGGRYKKRKSRKSRKARKGRKARKTHRKY